MSELRLPRRDSTPSREGCVSRPGEGKRRDMDGTETRDRCSSDGKAFQPNSGSILAGWWNAARDSRGTECGTRAETPQNSPRDTRRDTKPIIATSSQQVKAVVTPAACPRCGGGLAPYLLVVGDRRALLCPACRRFVYVGGAA